MSLLMNSHCDEKDRVSIGVLENFLFVFVIFVESYALFDSIMVKKGI